MVSVRLLFGRVFIEARCYKHRMDYKEIELMTGAFLGTYSMARFEQRQLASAATAKVTTVL